MALKAWNKPDTITAPITDLKVLHRFDTSHTRMSSGLKDYGQPMLRQRQVQCLSSTLTPPVYDFAGDRSSDKSDNQP